MRITTPQITALMHSAMNASSEKLCRLMQQMATGERMLLPSDDPIASIQVLRVQREEAARAQFRDNIARLSDSLSVQEVNLSAASDTMLQIQDLLLWAANLGPNATEDLAAIAGELATLAETIASFANVRDEEGRYLLSGTLSTEPAIRFDSVTGQYVLGGNDTRRQAAVANGVLVEENVTAAEIFGPGVNLLNSLRALVNTLQDPALDPADPAVAAQIHTALGELDTTHRALLGALTELGGRQNSLTLVDEAHQDVSLVNQRIEGELTQLDYASAVIDLSNYQLALQATQQTYLKINGLSLFSQL